MNTIIKKIQTISLSLSVMLSRWKDNFFCVSINPSIFFYSNSWVGLEPIPALLKVYNNIYFNLNLDRSSRFAWQAVMQSWVPVHKEKLCVRLWIYVWHWGSGFGRVRWWHWSAATLFPLDRDRWCHWPGSRVAGCDSLSRAGSSPGPALKSREIVKSLIS